MKLITTIFLLFVTLFTYGQSPIVKVGCAEYLTVYLYQDGTVKAASQQAYTPAQATFSIDSIKGVDGGQYGCVAWDTAGKVYELFAASGFALSATMVGNDEDAQPFTDNRNVTCMYRAFISIRGEDSTLWYWGIGDPLNLYAGATITAPVALDMPSGGRKMKKILGVGNAGLSNGLTALYGLATDGTLWKWSRGTATPAQVTGMDTPILDFSCTGFYSVLAATATKLYAFGMFDSRYSGASSHSSTPVDVTSNWTGVGLTMPVKELSGNTHSMHVIDANDNLFGSGSNTMGNVGIGSEYTPMRTLPSPFEIDISENSAMLVSPQQIMGKVKNLQKGQTIAFYGFVQDMGDNWYSWGRNKVMCLGNGITLPAYGGDGYDDYPNALDVVAPISVEPDTLGTWNVIENWNPNDSVPPFAGAGFNQYINTTSTTLYGKYFQQEHAITGYEWTQVSGASCTIVSPTNANTSITGLTEGSYTFRFTVTNSNEQTSFDDVLVRVSGAPPAPAGCTNCIITTLKFKNK